MTERMTETPANDTRFQFKVIENLAESVRQMATNMADLQRTQVDMLVRLARLEENKVAEELTAIKADVKAIDIRIDALFRDKDRRDGATGVFGFFLKYGPVIFSAFAAVWLFGRSLGVVPAPPVPTPTIERANREPGK